MRPNHGIGNTMRSKILFISILLSLFGLLIAFFCYIRTPPGEANSDGGHAKAVKTESHDLRIAPEFTAVSEDDCRSICERIFLCGIGPFQKQEHCEIACDGAKEDAITSKNYDCISQAKNCKAVIACSK